MATKTELLNSLPFRYIKHFTIKSGVLRKRGYHSKKDHVQGLSKAMTKEEVEYLAQCYEDNIDPKKAAERYLRHFRPDEEIVKQEFLDYLSESIEPEEEAIFCEFPLGGNRSDVNRFNGSSYTYELKSPRDSFRRVSEQIKTYEKVFEYITLVLPAQFSIPGDIPESIGILRYNYPEFEFHVENEPQYSNQTCPEKQLSQLWMNELYDILDLGPKGSGSITDKAELVNEVNREYSGEEVNNIFKRRIKSRHGVN